MSEEFMPCFTQFDKDAFKEKKMTIDEHRALGHVLVGNWGLDVGEKYTYNYGDYKIIEIFDEGHCWIEKVNKRAGIKI